MGNQIELFFKRFGWASWFVFYVVGDSKALGFAKSKVFKTDVKLACAQLFNNITAGDIVSWAVVARVSAMAGDDVDFNFLAMHESTQAKFEKAALKMIDAFFEGMKQYEILENEIDWAGFNIGDGHNIWALKGLVDCGLVADAGALFK